MAAGSGKMRHTVAGATNNHTRIVAVRSGSGDGRYFHFLANQCADCPVWSQCRSQRPGSTRMRQVFISDYRLEVVAARLYNQTDDYKADMQSRFLVERIIAALVRHKPLARSNSYSATLSFVT